MYKIASVRQSMCVNALRLLFCCGVATALPLGARGQNTLLVQQAKGDANDVKPYTSSLDTARMKAVQSLSDNLSEGKGIRDAAEAFNKVLKTPHPGYVHGSITKVSPLGTIVAKGSIDLEVTARVDVRGWPRSEYRLVVVCTNLSTGELASFDMTNGDAVPQTTKIGMRGKLPANLAPGRYDLTSILLARSIDEERFSMFDVQVTPFTLSGGDIDR